LTNLYINATVIAEPTCRAKPRLSHPFPIKVQGMDIEGEEFTLNTVLDNLSVGGMYFRMPYRVEREAYMSINIRLSSSTQECESGMEIAAYGKVLRVEEIQPGEYGIAVAFKHHRIL
jgi:hypothetical protein